MNKTIIHSPMLMVGVMPMYDEPARLVNLPTTVRGFVFHDDAGDPHIVLNARLTREQNERTYRHEQNHIELNELDDPTYIEYKEG